jgi:hypothetical protein
MKVACKATRNVVWATVARFLAGLMALLWLARWFVRLMPRVLGGEGVYAWAELVERTYRAVER